MRRWILIMTWLTVAAIVAGAPAAWARQTPPAPPAPPLPPSTPVTSPADFLIEKDQTHTGDLTLFRNSARIDGTLDGNLRFFGSNLAIVGKVDGNVRFFGAVLDISGSVTGDLQARGATVTLRKDSRIEGSVDVFAGQAILEGFVGQDAEASGGEVRFSGQTGGDARFEADVLKVEREAKIGGSLSYRSREPTEVDEGIVAGHVDDEGTKIEHRRRGDFGARFAWWLVRLVVSVAAGLGTVAIFRRVAAPVFSAAEGDVIRNVGVGFLTLIVVPVALLLSCLLIVTIPFALIALLVFALLVYLARFPVAMWIGGWLLPRIGRPEAGPYARVVTGVVAIYLLLAIPVVKWFVFFVVTFLGLGAVVFGMRAMWLDRRARRATRWAGAAVGEPPPPPVPTEPPPPTALAGE